MVELALLARTPAEAQGDVNALRARDERASANRVRLAGPALWSTATPATSGACRVHDALRVGDAPTPPTSPLRRRHLRQRRRNRPPSHYARVADRPSVSSPRCSTRLGLHQLREVLPLHPVVELLAIRRPPVDATLTDEQSASDGLVRVDDDLGVAIHDRALRKVEIERVFGHEASVEHASEGVKSPPGKTTFTCSSRSSTDEFGDAAWDDSDGRLART